MDMYFLERRQNLNKIDEMNKCLSNLLNDIFEVGTKDKSSKMKESDKAKFEKAFDDILKFIDIEDDLKKKGIVSNHIIDKDEKERLLKLKDEILEYDWDKLTNKLEQEIKFNIDLLYYNLNCWWSELTIFYLEKKIEKRKKRKLKKEKRKLKRSER